MSQVNLSERALSIEPSLTLQISAKANQLSAEGVDICNLSAGEPDFNAPKEVIEATSEAIFDGFTKYGPAAGNLDLRKAITNKLQIQNNLNLMNQDNDNWELESAKIFVKKKKLLEKNESYEKKLAKMARAGFSYDICKKILG